jgi:hypothetical protein
VFFLSEKAFMAWYLREEGLTPAEAAKKWQDDKDNANVARRSENDLMKLAVQGAAASVPRE